MRRANTCVFEYVYLARPDTTIATPHRRRAPRDGGRILARENPIEADLVMPTPDSGTPAAIGYAGVGPASPSRRARERLRGSHLHRTHAVVAPAFGIRLVQLAARGHRRQRLVIDDSIVRGNTQRAGRMPWRVWAAEVHIRILRPRPSCGRASSASTDVR